MEKKKLWQQIFQYTLAETIIIGFFALLYLLLRSETPPANKEILNLVVGALIAAFSMIVGYFFGSSKGSADKTELIKNGNKP